MVNMIGSLPSLNRDQLEEAEKTVNDRQMEWVQGARHNQNYSGDSFSEKIMLLMVPTGE